MCSLVGCCQGICVTSELMLGVRVACVGSGGLSWAPLTPHTIQSPTQQCHRCGTRHTASLSQNCGRRRYSYLQRHLARGSVHSPGGSLQCTRSDVNIQRHTYHHTPYSTSLNIPTTKAKHTLSNFIPTALSNSRKSVYLSNTFHHYGSHTCRGFHQSSKASSSFGKTDDKPRLPKWRRQPNVEGEEEEGSRAEDHWLDGHWGNSVFTTTRGDRPEPETLQEYALRRREERAARGDEVMVEEDLNDLELEIDDKRFKNFDEQLFDLLCDKTKERVSVSKLWTELSRMGLWRSDPRLKETVRSITKAASTDGVFAGVEFLLERDQFGECIRDNIVLVRRAFTGDLVVPDFLTFTSIIDGIYNNCKTNTSGKVADYIPQLARYSADYWGVSLCTVDGQRHSIGDVNVPFSLQSASKPISYALAMSNLGADEVHEFVGHEPSGESFNHIKLGKGNKPHNPMINAGAIITASLLKNKLTLADRFEFAINQFRRMAGNDPLGFNNSVFLSERATADRNFALAYYMKENKCFPEGVDLHETLDFYFMLCSIEATCESGAVMAATLANGGICPTSGEKVLDSTAVRNTLSLMHSCGMYDYSGEFAFKVGLPGKSGVSGVILLVVPNVAGFALWGPALDLHGNSVRGIQFCQELVRAMNFHHYDNLKYTPKKFDPRQKPLENQGSKVVQLLFGAYNGDVTALTRMALAGENMSVADYDGRTALHLAAAEGHLDCVRFLLEKCHVDIDPQDRWNGTPMDDARRFEREDVVKYLEKHVEIACFTEESDTEGPEP